MADLPRSRYCSHRYDQWCRTVLQVERAHAKQNSHYQQHNELTIIGLKEHRMEARFNFTKAAPGGYRAMLGLEQYLHSCGLEESLLHLIKLRISQINGCAYCLDMHWKDLRAMG